jgi:hypothetical protein
MHKNSMNCNKTQSKWCINKHGASKIIDTFETYHALSSLTFTFTLPLLLLSYVKGNPLNPRTLSSHIYTTSQNAAIWFSGLGQTERCSCCQSASLKSQTKNHGRSEVAHRAHNKLHILWLVHSKLPIDEGSMPQWTRHTLPRINVNILSINLLHIHMHAFMPE